MKITIECEDVSEVLALDMVKQVLKKGMVEKNKSGHPMHKRTTIFKLDDVRYRVFNEHGGKYGDKFFFIVDKYATEVKSEEAKG